MAYSTVSTDLPDGLTLSDAAEWLRTRWTDFLRLEPRIVDLQHRAALARQAARAQGDTSRADAALLLIQELGKLNLLHGKAVDFAQPYVRALGLGAFPIPVVIAGAVATLAIWVAWIFRKYDIQERALDALEGGWLSPAQFDAFQEQAGPGPEGLVASATSALKWVVFGLLGLALLQTVRSFKPNPPLDIIHANPPNRFSGRVLSLAYVHDDDDEPYQHNFRPGVQMEALPDGQILLSHPTREIWREYD